MMIELPRKAKGERPYYFADRNAEIGLGVALALAAEVSVLREELDTLRRVLDESGELQAKLAAYQPDEKVAAEREAERAKFIDLVMRPFKVEYEALVESAEKNIPLEEVVASVVED